MENILFMVGSLVIILLGAEAFTNSIEWFGKKLNLNEGAVGSVLAAVGTALPETIIPLIAIFLNKGEGGADIGVGAILGAPFMLATLAFFVTGAAAFVFAFLGRRSSALNVDFSVITRDLQVFLVVFLLAVVAAYVPNPFRLVLALLLPLIYVWYVYRTFTDEPAEPEIMEDVDLDLKPLYCCLSSKDPSLLLIIFQILLSLVLIITGAHLFVKVIEHTAQLLQIPSLILALVIAPIATELPEKLNSIIWVGQKKDTLALGNITGAMVFQSTIGPTIGIILTPWVITGPALLSVVLALASAFLVYFLARKQKKVSPYGLLAGGAFYSIFLAYLVSTI